MKIEYQASGCRLQASSRRGFTLVEMLVVIFIISVISAVALMSGRQFDSSVFLTDTAYEVSLAIREAQSYGINVRGAGGDAGTFRTGYGIEFDNGNKTQFVLFADAFEPSGESGNGIKDSGEEAINTYALKRGLTIGRLCVYNSGNSEKCSGGGINMVTVVFTRPNPEPTIKPTPASGFCRNDKCSRAEITITTKDEQQKTVVVYNTGQISVKSGQ